MGSGGTDAAQYNPPAGVAFFTVHLGAPTSRDSIPGVIRTGNLSERAPRIRSAGGSLREPSLTFGAYLTIRKLLLTGPAVPLATQRR
jgi:hypothetical protein